MDGLTIHEAAETTGWSPRMLRYLETVGLIEPPRNGAGYRIYGAGELQRLRTLRDLLDRHGLGPADVAFAKRMRAEAAQGRAHHGLASHDGPDGRSDRDARRARRRGPLGQLQHLLDAGPRRRRDRRRRHPRFRLEGRDARGVLVVHRAGAQLARP